MSKENEEKDLYKFDKLMYKECKKKYKKVILF